MPELTLTRQQLYDRAWTAPIQKLARELGLSDRGLCKLCARYDIPVPARGYWAKKKAGKRVSQPKLPTIDDPYRQKIYFEVGEPPMTEVPKPDVHPLVAFEQQPDNQIRIPDDLQLTHPLVLKAERALRRSKRHPNGLITVPAGSLHIHTSRALHERALRIMQALIAAFETRGFTVTATTDGVRVTILGEPLGFGIEELLAKVPHRTSFTDQKLIDRGLSYQVPKVDQVPSGKLVLVITNVRGVRQRWAEDGKPLEEMLNKFLIGLVRAALGVKEQRAEAERREKERQEEERKRQEEERRLAEAELRWREEKARVERLERLHELWLRNQELRTVVANLQKAVGKVEAESELSKWVAWATNYAERSDPLRRVRDRGKGVLTLYYHEYDQDRVAVEGFKEPELTGYGNDKTKPGIKLTDRPPQRSAYEHALKLDLPEDLLLPYEWAQESDWYWRVFRVPAALVNRTLGYGGKVENEEL